MSICALSVICISVLYSVDFNPNTNKTLISVIFSICTILTLDKLYRGMLVTLLMGRDMTRAFTIEKGQHRSILDLLRGTAPAPVVPDMKKQEAAQAQRGDALNYNPKDSASMLHRKKAIMEELAALQAELAELMQREMYCPTNSGVSISGVVSSVEQFTKDKNTFEDNDVTVL
jgi:hypothetical protein